MNAKRLILITGGVRSGKSDFALKLAQEIGGPVLFVATATAEDDEMRQRIAEHQSRRPAPEAGWRTLERSMNLADAIAVHEDGAQVVVIDCLNFWVFNVLAATSSRGPEEPDPPAAQARMVDELGALHDWFRASPASLIVVTNEVGMGLAPPYPSGRAFRDLLGWANQFVSTRATEVYLLVAGIPIELKRLASTPWAASGGEETRH